MSAREDGALDLDELFAQARADAPPPAVREAVWKSVALATLPAAAIGAGSAAVAKKLTISGGTKLLALGTLSGAVGTAILALSLSDPGGTLGPPAAPASVRRAPAVVVGGHAGGARLAEAPPRERAATTSVTAAPVDEASSLAEEARLVTEARLALVGGYAERALALARSTHALPVRTLEPEELALEARALRALGRAEEASRLDEALRRRFPEHALAR